MRPPSHGLPGYLVGRLRKLHKPQKFDAWAGPAARLIAVWHAVQAHRLWRTSKSAATRWAAMTGMGVAGSGGRGARIAATGRTSTVAPTSNTTWTIICSPPAPTGALCRSVGFLVACCAPDVSGFQGLEGKMNWCLRRHFFLPPHPGGFLVALKVCAGICGRWAVPHNFWRPSL